VLFLNDHLGYYVENRLRGGKDYHKKNNSKIFSFAQAR
jgi:hypothetical protein